MGAHLVRRYITETDTEPDPSRKYEFDPQFGFPERKERGLSAVTSSKKPIAECYNVIITIWIDIDFLISHARPAQRLVSRVVFAIIAVIR